VTPGGRLAVSGQLLEMSFRSRQILTAVALAASLWPSLVLSEPQAAFSPTQYQFGDVRRGEQVTRTFRLHNGGDTPLELIGVRFSMPGMSARLPRTVAPGGDAAIVLEWSTDRVQGSVRGVATVETNDPRAGSVPLLLAGTVHGPLDIEPVPAVFLSAFRGEDIRRELTLRSNQPGPVTLRLASQRGPHHVANLETMEPGRSWRLTVKPAVEAAPGRYEETLELQSSDTAIGTLRLPVHVLVKADLYVGPDEIDFGEIPLDRVRLQPNAAAFLEQTAFVKKREGQFRLRGVRSDVDALVIRVTPSSGASGTFRIDVGLRAEALRAKSLEGTIAIDTDDPTFPHLTLRVLGRVVDKSP
jgi:Protein of unknown function (DUF1573)